MKSSHVSLQAKASGRTPEEYEKKGDLTGASVLRHYNEILRSCNALDYHDFINSSITLLMNFPEVYKECQDMWQAIVVDEFQDTSAMQYCLLKLLASHSRITIVGDEDQSIFSFNGANASGFDSFRRDFPNHKEIRLSKNYRSTRAIVEAATALIHNNTKRHHHKLVETDNPSGCKITVKECHSEDSQCAFVIDKIIETTSSSAECCNFGNVAVLYRRQITGKAFQVFFRNRKIPFNIHGVAFYRKKLLRLELSLDLRLLLHGVSLRLGVGLSQQRLMLWHAGREGHGRHRRPRTGPYFNGPDPWVMERGLGSTRPTCGRAGAAGGGGGVARGRRGRAEWLGVAPGVPALLLLGLGRRAPEAAALVRGPPARGRAKASGRTPEEYEKKGDLTGCGHACAVYKECQDMWQAIVVDEFQDTSAMQYCLLKLLASHSRITIVGDEDQSIFSFNGANASGFDSFRRDFPNHKEIRLSKNYRSTRAIVEAATALIHNNTKRHHHKLVETDNPSGCKITVKECHSEDSQCAFVIDKIIETTSSSAECCNFGNVAVLYRRQITGKAFQVFFRNRKIPFNIHGVAFYRKKIIKAIMAILRTTLPGCDDGPWRQAFKALLPSDKEEKKKV
ncbi:hypothetical protein PR202_gb20881 [Eleusine coracana subsp. coracana]|uniref:DNA 3'-5' helicase n=1 Tax=Eleusine coracana subsp. coracana TaxID=191504 RepID=A0AAV5FBT6_ELECO|nr:hypothetical protein PR202_gb20881 [Eleusine coracana subsp. coracana]